MPIFQVNITRLGLMRLTRTCIASKDRMRGSVRLARVAFPMLRLQEIFLLLQDQDAASTDLHYFYPRSKKSFKIIYNQTIHTIAQTCLFRFTFSCQANNLRVSSISLFYEISAPTGTLQQHLSSQSRQT